MFRFDFLRTIRRFLLFGDFMILGLVGLSIALSALMVISAWSIQEMRYDRFYNNSESIYMLTTDIRHNTGDVTSFPETPPPLAGELSSKIPDIIAAAHFVYFYGGKTIENEDFSFNERGIAADSEFFRVLNFPLQSGDPHTLDELSSILLSEELAGKLFPDQDPTGKSIFFDGNREFIVQGVLGNIPENSSLKFDFIVPYWLFADEADNWWQLSGATFIRISENSNASKIKEIAQDIFRKNISDEQYSLGLIPVTKLRYGADFSFFEAEHGNSQKKNILITVAFLLIILACLNYANLLLAEIYKRKAEVVIRKVVGAGRSSLMLSFITESVANSTIVWFIAVLFSSIILYILRIKFDLHIMNNYLLAAWMFGFFFSIICVGVLAGLLPSLRSGTISPVVKTDSYQTFKGSGKNLQKLFIFLQFVLSITLTIISLVILRQLNFIKEYNTGYEKENISSIVLPGSIKDSQSVILDRLFTLPGILEVSSGRASPVNLAPFFSTENWHWKGLDPNAHTSIYRLFVDSNYLKVFEIKLLKGRFFSAGGGNEDQVVINVALADLTGFEDPVGQIIRRGEKEYEIIGVVDNFHFQHLSNKIKPLLFMHSIDRNRLFIRTEDNITFNSLSKEIERIFADYTDEKISFESVEQNYREMYLSENRLALLIIIFTSLTILLSSMELIAVIAIIVSLKTKEIGIRKVHGASLYELMLLLNRGILIIFFVGFLVSYYLSWFLAGRWLANFSIHINLGGWLFISGGIIILFITVLTLSFQTLRAATKNPVYTLRYE